jgi:hypothetical protein
LSTRRRKPYRRGRMSISVYDRRTLEGMAIRGNLFVLHLRTEGIILRDPAGALLSCLDAYVAPDNYEPQRATLRELANLLDVSIVEYTSSWHAYGSLALYVLRSALYADAAERGQPMFSMSAVLKLLSLEYIAPILHLKEIKHPDPLLFQQARSAVSTVLGTSISNPYGSAEAFITNSGRNPLIVAFGLRLLGGDSFDLTYDLLDFPPVT